jgi:monoamine oxidase
VETAGENPGTITARAVIVTVSTGVMNSGAIRFMPPLPNDHQAAFANVPMGLLAKIPFLIPGLGREPNAPQPYANILDERGGRQNIYFKARPWDSDLMVGFVGGDFAWELSAAGEKAAIDFATQRLSDIFNTDMSEKVKKGLLTPWASNPFALGAYAMAKPGDFKSREIIKHSVNDRVFFAGEAMAPDPDGMFGTCSGAYNSGMAVAGKVAATLKQSKA